MADPTPYEPSYSFSGWQATNPQKPLPAAQVDAQLADVSEATVQIVDALKDVRRSDGALQNGIVTKESLAGDVLIGLAPPTAWATATDYAPPNLVFNGPKLYLCLVPHTSGVFLTDYANEKWVLIADFTPTEGLIDADNVTFDPTGTDLVATDVQAALVEQYTFAEVLASSKADVSSLGALATLSTVGTDQIGTSAVTAAKLASNAVTTAKILDATITGAKLASDVPFRKAYTSGELSIVNDASTTLAHGLGATPKRVLLQLICKTTDSEVWAGVAVGNVVDIPSAIRYEYIDSTSATILAGVEAVATSSEIFVKIGYDGVVLVNSGGHKAALTNAKWRLIVRAVL